MRTHALSSYTGPVASLCSVREGASKLIGETIMVKQIKSLENKDETN